MKRYESVELIITGGSTGNTFEYPDLPNLRDDVDQDIIICGLETFSIAMMPLNYNGNVVASIAQLQNSFLNLYVNGEESVRQIPFIRLMPTFTAGGSGVSFANFEPFEVDNLKVNWNKSFIQTGAAYGNEEDFSIMLNVYYKKLPPGMWKKLTANQVPGM